MAPERFDGHSLPQSDVYALGATLYEMLALRPAFDATSKARLIEQVLHEPPVPPRRLDPHVPRDLETVVLKCLAKDPAERYATAEALAEDLRRFLADRPIKARRSSSAEQLWRWSRRNPVVARLLGAVAALLVAVSAVSTFSAVRVSADRERIRQAEGDARRAARQARLGEAEALVGEAHGIRHSRRPGQRFEALAALRKAADIGRELRQPPEWFDRLRTEAVACLLLPDFQVAKEWDGWTKDSTSLAIDPAFQRYARGGLAGTVSVRRLSDDEELCPPLPGDAPVAGLEFSPDGRFLHHRCSTGLGIHSRVWRLDGPRPVVVLDSDYRHHAFSPDGLQLATAHPDGSIRLHELETGRELKRYPKLYPVGTPWGQMCWNPRRPVLAVSCMAKAYKLIDLETGEAQPEVPVPGGFNAMDWHPEGRLLAVSSSVDSSQLPRIYLWDTTTHQLALPPLEGHKVAGVVARFSHAGDRLLSTDWNRVGRLWDTRTGQLLLTQPQINDWLHFSPDDRLVGIEVTVPKLRLFRFDPGQEFRTVVHRSAGAAGGFDRFGHVLDPQGRLFASDTWDGTALVDLVRGEEVALLPLPENFPLHFEPSGALLTHGTEGILRWPLAVEADTGRRRYGPPQRLHPRTNIDGHGASADGRVLAIPSYSRGALVLRRSENRVLVLEPQEDVRVCAVSPDGRWIATGSHVAIKGPGAKVWDAESGRHVRDLPVGGYCGVGFSPKGRWLMTAGGGLRLWSVGTWDEGPPLGGPLSAYGFAFSADDELLALEGDSGTVRLVLPATGKEVARLTAPEGTGTLHVCGFTPDGTRLVCGGRESQWLHIFDLRRIRAGLAEMDLDWDAPPYPAAAPVVPGPLEVQFVGTELLDPKKMAEHERRRAVSDLFFNPFDAYAHYRLGKSLLEAEKPGPAHAYLTAALAFRPDLHEARYQRARAAYGLKHWADAAADATEYLNRHPDSDGARSLRARALRLSRRFEEAARDYTALIQRYPKDRQLYTSRALCHEALGDTDRAKADREQAFAVGPRDPMALNNLAWSLANGPAEQHDPALALQLIEEAIKQQPENATLLNTLGVVQYRNALYPEAVATLEKSLATGKGAFDGFDLFFLAMCHARLGDAARAGDCFDRAVRWTQAQKNLNAQHAGELKAFRAEAEGVLAETQRPEAKKD
jgi:WD40 repeat protein/tetratricopeptide (TPR) repeat protein